MTDNNHFGPLKRCLLEEELFTRKWRVYQITGKRTSAECGDAEISDYKSIVLVYHRKDLDRYVERLIKEHNNARIIFCPEIRERKLDFKDEGLAEIIIMQEN